MDAHSVGPTQTAQSICDLRIVCTALS